jgi:hypothetical protein
MQTVLPVCVSGKRSDLRLIGCLSAPNNRASRMQLHSFPTTLHQPRTDARYRDALPCGD